MSPGKWNMLKIQVVGTCQYHLKWAGHSGSRGKASPNTSVSLTGRPRLAPIHESEKSDLCWASYQRARANNFIVESTRKWSVLELPTLARRLTFGT